MDTSKIRAMFEYEFQRGTNAVGTAGNIYAAFGEEIANEWSVRFWFWWLCNGNLDMKNEPAQTVEQRWIAGNGPVVEVGPSQTSQILGAWSLITLSYQHCQYVEIWSLDP